MDYLIAGALFESASKTPGHPVLARGPDGLYVEQSDPMQPSAEVTIDSYERVANGPMTRVLEWRNYAQLPEHAAEPSEVWGHAKRFWRRLPELTERVTQGIYDRDGVEALGTPAHIFPRSLVRN